MSEEIKQLNTKDLQGIPLELLANTINGLEKELRIANNKIKALEIALDSTKEGHIATEKEKYRREVLLALIPVSGTIFNGFPIKQYAERMHEYVEALVP